MSWPKFKGLDKHKTGSGFLLAAPEGTPIPSLGASVVNGKFTATWDAAWKQLGRTTEDGINITRGQETASFTSSQEQEPFESKITSRSANVSFTLYDYNQFNIKVALNGGNWSVTGSGGSRYAEYTPAGPGEETYTMLAWIGPKDDDVFIFYKTLSSAEVSMDMTRDDPRPMALNMQALVPAPSIATKSYKHFTAGTSYSDDGNDA